MKTSDFIARISWLSVILWLWFVMLDWVKVSWSSIFALVLFLMIALVSSVLSEYEHEEGENEDHSDGA